MSARVAMSLADDSVAAATLGYVQLLVGLFDQLRGRRFHRRLHAGRSYADRDRHLGMFRNEVGVCHDGPHSFAGLNGIGQGRVGAWA